MCTRLICNPTEKKLDQPYYKFQPNLDIPGALLINIDYFFVS